MESSEPQPRLNFLSLPRELRDMIYTLVLKTRAVIKIRSPHSKTGDRELCKYRGNSYRSLQLRRCGIIQVNKQTYSEATRILYAVSTISVSHGAYGSRDYANLHGLKAFVRRLPREHLALVKNVEVRPTLDYQQWFENDATSGWDDEWASMYGEERRHSDQEKDLETIAKIVVRKFTSLQYVEIILPDLWQSISNQKILPDSYNLLAMKRAIELFLKIPDIKEIRLKAFPDGCRTAQVVFDAFLETNPGAAEVVKLCIIRS